MTQLLTVGVIGKSLKENEKRVAIHPEHIKRIPHRLRKQIIVVIKKVPELRAVIKHIKIKCRMILLHCIF